MLPYPFTQNRFPQVIHPQDQCRQGNKQQQKRNKQNLHSPKDLIQVKNRKKYIQTYSNKG